MISVIQGGDGANTLAFVDMEEFIKTYDIKAIRINQAAEPEFLILDEAGTLVWAAVGELELPATVVTPLRLS